MTLPNNDSLERASWWTARASDLSGVVQKRLLGERVELILKLGRGGPRWEQLPPSAPRYVPRLGAFGGGGMPFVVEAAEMPAQAASYVGRTGGSAEYIGRISDGAAFRRAGAASKHLGWAGNGLSFAASAAGQWSRDAERPGAERTARATYRGAAQFGAGWAGAWVGTTAVAFLSGAASGVATGAAAGTVVPGPGTAIGATVGGIVAGYLGAKAATAVADKIVDYTIDPVGKYLAE